MFPGRKRFLLTRTVCPTLHEQRVPARMRAGRVNDQLSWMPMLALKGASDGMRRPVRHLNATATAPGLLGFWRANLTLFERVGRFRQKRGKSQVIKKKTHRNAWPGEYGVSSRLKRAEREGAEGVHADIAECYE